MRGRVDLSESGESVIERLRRQSHAAAEVEVAGVCFKPDQPVRMILVGFFQPFECLIFIAQTGIDCCDVEGRDVSLSAPGLAGPTPHKHARARLQLGGRLPRD